ncbi:hypothetical protein CsatB_019031 [Cannabis sativa]
MSTSPPVVGDPLFHIERVDNINAISVSGMSDSFFIIHLFAKFSRIPENESDEDFRALLLNHGVEDAVCYDNVLFIPREKLMNSDNTDAKEIINQMLGDTHLHTYVYVVTDKIIDYALRKWTGDFCCNLSVTVDISVLVYVHPEHNSDTEDDHVSENGSIDFVAASEASINKLEKCLNKNELLCNICFENVHNDVEVRKLPCKHSYHGECIVKWLKTSKYCPLL